MGSAPPLPFRERGLGGEGWRGNQTLQPPLNYHYASGSALPTTNFR